VLRAFTARRIGALAPEITQLTHDLIDAAPEGDFDLLKHFGQRLPVIVIARLLGVPETMSDDLLRWSNAMVAMYVAGPTRATEVRAATAAADFADCLRAYVAERRTRPADDLITHLIAAEAEGEKLTTDELVGTCILLLNAGHEATVHTIGNGVKTLLAAGIAPTPDTAPAITEEILRYDPPLHLFTRYAYDDIEVQGQLFPKGSQVALLLAAANRDPHAYDAPAEFRPDRAGKPNLALGAGLHFCVGAPLARLELNIALPILFARLPGLCLTEAPVFGNVYHFHGLQRLMVARA
jgi:unspecific monooxygenase